MFRHLHDRFDALESRLDLIDRTLVVKDPGSVRSAEAFEGLRKSIIAAVQERNAHIADLAQLDAHITAGASRETIVLLVGDLLRRAGVERIDRIDRTNAEHLQDFEVVEGSGARLEVIEPAYVDHTGRPVRRGRARALEDDRELRAVRVEAPVDAAVTSTDGEGR